jgi:hypothetical protein
MLRSVKNIFWLLATVVGAQSALGFALIGPTDVAGTADSFETADIAYNVGAAEHGTPKSLHDEYRRNTPIIYYAADQSFIQYFRGTNGDEGLRELDKAFAMYNSVGKVSQLNVDDYPEDSRRPNFQAQAIGLMDLKSEVMGLMSEQVGLFQPSRWVWMLSLRQQIPNVTPTCPFNMAYDIQQRNYSADPVGQADPPTSSYVNGVLYSYFILETCRPPNPIADAVEMPVDPLSQPYSAVADFSSLNYIGLLPGVFYTSLTRDDVAGMKYLYATNNFNNEAAGGRVTEFVTNDTPQFIQTQDLGALAAAAKVNNAATLAGLFPGLQITSSSNYFGFAITTNITQTLVNSPLDPAGTAPSHSIFSTNYTTNVVNFFVHSFGNIVTNTYATRGIIGVVTAGISNSPFAPAGTPPTTNIIAIPTTVSGVFGDFFILPTNDCGALVISNLLTTVTSVTNLPVQLATGGTNSFTFTPGSITFQTNHTVLFLPVTCPVDAVGLRGGMDQIQFVRRDYDGLTSQLWDPVTNDYTLVEINDTNHTSAVRHFSRRVPKPDILFSAADLSSQNASVTYSNTIDGASEVQTLTLTIAQGAGIWSVVDIDAGLYNEIGRTGNEAGPGTILSGDPLPTIYIFNRQFPVFENFSPTGGQTNYTIQATQASFGAWAAFDGTTNAPLVFPNGTTFLELQNLLLGPASNTPFLPNGNVGVLYSAQLAAKGGTAPYTWSLAPTSAGLPAGLNISSDGKITGTPTGPAAIYDFTIRITDNVGIFRDVQYTITLL